MIGQLLEAVYTDKTFLTEKEFVGFLRKKDDRLVIVNERGQFVDFSQVKDFEIIGKDLREEAQEKITNLLGMLDPDKIENEDDMSAVITGAVEAVGDGKKIEDPEDQEFIKGLAVQLLGEWLEQSPLPRIEEAILKNRDMEIADKIARLASFYLTNDFGIDQEKAYFWITNRYSDEDLFDIFTSKYGKTEDDFIRLSALDVVDKSYKSLVSRSTPKTPVGKVGSYEARALGREDITPIVYNNSTAGHAKSEFSKATGVPYTQVRIKSLNPKEPLTESDSAKDVKDEDWYTGEGENLNESDARSFGIKHAIHMMANKDLTTDDIIQHLMKYGFSKKEAYEAYRDQVGPSYHGRKTESTSEVKKNSTMN